jgi:FtsX-like permease family
MGAVRLIARVELRQRWPSLLGVAVLVALVSGAVLAALVGAQRTSTTVARFRDWAAASDVTYQARDADRAEAMLAAVRRLPETETAATRLLVNGFPLDQSIPDIAVLSDPEGVFGKEVDRPMLLAGRLPDPDSPDEILLSEQAARLTRLGPGDRIRVRTWRTDDLEALSGGADFPGFNGPELDLRIVGVGRTPEELPSEVRRGSLDALGSPALMAAHPGLGAWPPAVVVRIRGGDAAVGAVTARLRPLLAAGDAAPASGVLDVDPKTAAEVYVDTAQSTVDSLATGLLLFAAAAVVAGAIAVGQAVTRHLAAGSTSLRTLRSLGLTRSQAALAVSLPLVACGLVGTVAGAALAVAASPLLPVGLARRAEVDPGLWIGPGLLALGASVILALLAAGAFAAARRAHGVSVLRATGPGRRDPALARAVIRLGASPTLATGVRMASDRGRGAAAVPVRPAFVGLTIGIAGALAAGVIAVSLQGLTSNPYRWGWTWSTMPDSFGESPPTNDLVDDPRVESAGMLQANGLIIDGSPVTAFAMDSLKGSLSFTGLDGRLPSGPGEIALGAQTMTDLGVSIGETVQALVPPDGTSTRALVVVGTAVIPPTEDNAPDVGAILTPEGLASVSQAEDLVESPVLRYPSGADVGALEAGLAADYGLQFGIFTKPQVPGSIRNLAEERGIAVALAAFFVGLGCIGLFHALLVSTRRRRAELAVLRALGLRRPQVRGTILVEALALAAAGAVIGVPAGLITGRLVWRTLVAGLGAVADPAIPWALMAVTVPFAAIVAALLSWVPGRSAVRAVPADDLRAE